jgi:kynurenine formamidase
MTNLPSEDEVLRYFDQLSNWGRWGSADTNGTLNYITDSKRVDASRLVQRGRVVSCCWDIDTDTDADETVAPPQRYMIAAGEGLLDKERVVPPGATGLERHAITSEYLGMAYHGTRVTHLDALSHVFWDAKMYNGLPAEMVSGRFGATAHSITNLREGIITRGILLDLPRYRGVQWLNPGEFITPDEITNILDSAGLSVKPGDCLMLRTGYGKRRTENGPDAIHKLGRPGWHAACLPWIHENNVAAICSDTATDVIPSGYPKLRIPVHAIGISAMGLWLVDNCNLEELAAVCAELNQWEFQLQISPLPFVGATGSPVNPLAVF